MMQMLKKFFGLKEREEIPLKKNSVYFDFFVHDASEVKVSIVAAVTRIIL